MASPTVRGGANSRSRSLRTVLRSVQLRHLPLFIRRWGAWTIEVSWVAASALVPFQLGLLADSMYSGEPVPLNPLLVQTERAIAKTLAIPVGDEYQRVAPLTNLLWSVAVLAPIAVAGLQLHQLARTGRTLPKRWLGVQVTTADGAQPGWIRIGVREGVGRWGLSLGLAYAIWLYSGAFPGLNILSGLAVLLLAGESLSAQSHPNRRAIHDSLAGTYVIDTTQVLQPYSGVFHPTQPLASTYAEPFWDTVDWTDEDGAIAAIVLAPDSQPRRPGLWHWMRQRPGTALVLFSLSSLTLLLGTFIGTQVYIQNRTTWRETQRQRDRVFLTLVDTLSTQTVGDRRAAVLALGTLDDVRAVPFLVDLLAQETNPALIDSIQQALVSMGPDSLPYLHRLNQALRTELASLEQSRESERNAVARRQRTTQQAIAKILTIYTDQLPSVDLSRVDLGRVDSGIAPFTLVLDQVNFSSLQLRGARLSHASLKNAQFHSSGPDERFNTFDDQIADLSGADLKGANLTGAILTHVRLNRTSLTGATLNKANLSYARLVQANLSSARLLDASLHQAVLENASLTGADLSHADLSQSNLQGANLGEITAAGASFEFANLSRSDWRNADVSRADFSRANLRDADLQSAQLTEANLSRAQLQNVNFQNANLTSADLRGANVDGANFQGAAFVVRTASSPDQFVRMEPDYVPSDRLQGVDFTHARHLDAEQLAYICAQGGLHPTCP